MLAGFGADLHVHLHCRPVVREAVCRAVGGDGLVHASEFLLDDSEPVGDELVGGGGNLVLVLDPVLVIDVDDHPQDILCPLGVDVTIGEVDDGGVLAVDVGAEAAAGGLGCTLEGAFGHEYGSVPLRLVGVFGAGYEDFAERGVGGVAVCGRDVFGPEFVLALGEVAEQDRGVLQLHRHCAAAVSAEVQEFDLDGEAAAVDGVLVAQAFDLVVHVQVEVPGYLEHQVG